jgi:hypothetical protein
LLGAALLLQPAVAQTVATGAFRNLAAIEATLVRGVTSKAEVRKQLGIPNGSGAARFASLGGDEREIWYYEDVEMTGAKSEEQGIKIDMRQQILLVLFKGEVVDGYLWTSNSGTGTAR